MTPQIFICVVIVLILEFGVPVFTILANYIRKL